MIQIFILISPFAFLSLINSTSEWFFKIWIKSFFSLLVVQLLISIILLFSYSIDITGQTILSKVLYVGVLYALTRANLFTKEIFGGISTNVSTSISNISQKFS